VFEEKTKSEQLAIVEKSKLFRDFNRLDLDNSFLKSDIHHLGVKLVHVKNLALEKELKMFVVKKDMH